MVLGFIILIAIAGCDVMYSFYKLFTEEFVDVDIPDLEDEDLPCI